MFGIAKIGKSMLQGIAEANQKPKLMTLEAMRKEVDNAGGNTEKFKESCKIISNLYLQCWRDSKKR